MTKLAQYNPPDGRLARFARDVRRILTPAEGGLSWPDNVGPTVTYSALGNATTATAALSERPSSVWLLRAVPPTGGGRVSGGTVAWSWESGTLSIASISGLTSSTTYQITLGILTERANA